MMPLVGFEARVRARFAADPERAPLLYVALISEGRRLVKDARRNNRRRRRIVAGLNMIDRVYVDHRSTVAA